MQVPVGYTLLVDGYNLMHAAGFTRRTYGPGGLERQRNRFLNQLARAVPSSLQSKTVIVFDANTRGMLSVGTSAHGRFRLYFTPDDLEADDLIEELIVAHSAPRTLQVISSDRRLKRAARRRRAKGIGSEDFLRALHRARQDRRTRRQAEDEGRKPTAELPEETAEWKEIFSDAQELANRELLLPPDEPEESRAKQGKQQKRRQPKKPVEEPKLEDIATDEVQFWEERLRNLLDGNE